MKRYEVGTQVSKDTFDSREEALHLAEETWRLGLPVCVRDTETGELIYDKFHNISSAMRDVLEECLRFYKKLFSVLVETQNIELLAHFEEFDGLPTRISNLLDMGKVDPEPK